MRQQSREHIIILFISGIVALNYPLLELFDRDWTLFGIPLLYLYLYLAWLIIIILLIIAVEHSEIREPGEPPKPLKPPHGGKTSAAKTLPSIPDTDIDRSKESS